MKPPSLFQNLQAQVLPMFQKVKVHRPDLTPLDEPNFLEAGDLVIHMSNGAAGHMLMICPEGKRLIDSTYPDGVGYNANFPPHYEIYRLKGQGQGDTTAYTAAYIAKNWVGKVKYGDSMAGKGLTKKLPDMPMRQIFAGVGTSGFGKGARARLAKYEGKGNKPKNVICSEMCILAYQMASLEGNHGFIRLDSKHATPPVVRDYLRRNSNAWDMIRERAFVAQI